MWLLLLPTAYAGSQQVLVTWTWGSGPGGVRSGLEIAAQISPGQSGLFPVVGGAVQLLDRKGALSAAFTARGGAVLGLHAGWLIDSHTVGLGAELEVGVSFGREGPAMRAGAVFTGGSPIGGPVAHVGPRVDLRADGAAPPELYYGVGLQALTPIPLIGSPGRPLRVAGRPVLFGALGRRGPALEAARAEWASVPAFLHLAAELEALGARELAARARAAALDEVRHTLAQLDAPALMELPFVPAVRPGSRDLRLARIAWESLVDGVIGEADAAERVDDEVIAREERAHAALAGDIVSWARGESALARGVT